MLYSELVPLTPEITWSKLNRYGENIGDKKLSVEHTRSYKLIQFNWFSSPTYLKDNT